MDVCCTLGAGDLTTLPDELMSTPGGRAVSLNGLGGGVEPTSVAAANASARRPRAGAPSTMPRSVSRTTYRVGGTACSWPSRWTPGAGAGRPCAGALATGLLPPGRCRSWCSATAPTCLWPTGGFDGLVVRLGPSVAGVDVIEADGRTPTERRATPVVWPCGPGERLACRSWPDGSVEAGLTGLE